MVPSSGNIVSINLRTKDIRQDGGEAANLATLKRNIVYTINSIRYYIKDFLLGIISYYPSAVVPIHTLNHAVDHLNTTVVALSRHGEFTAPTVGRALNLAQDMQVKYGVYVKYMVCVYLIVYAVCIAYMCVCCVLYATVVCVITIHL